jgi:hypothetical protein
MKEALGFRLLQFPFRTGAAAVILLALPLISEPGTPRARSTPPATAAEIATRAADLLAVERRLAGEIRSQLQATFPETDAGEGIEASLYSDVIEIAKTAVGVHPSSARAHAVLAAAYFARSYQGEGTFDRALVALARQEAEWVSSHLAPADPKDVREVEEILRRIRALKPDEIVD